MGPECLQEFPSNIHLLLITQISNKNTFASFVPHEFLPQISSDFNFWLLSCIPSSKIPESAHPSELTQPRVFINIGFVWEVKSLHVSRAEEFCLVRIMI